MFSEYPQLEVKQYLFISIAWPMTLRYFVLPFLFWGFHYIWYKTTTSMANCFKLFM